MAILEIKGRQVLIDDEDYESVNGVSWSSSRKDGRLKTRTYTKTVNIARYIMSDHMNVPENMIVAYINKDIYDNRKCNLELRTRKQSRLKARKSREYHRMGKKRLLPKYVYTCCQEGKFVAKIIRGGKYIHLGTFSCVSKAKLAVMKEMGKDFYD